MTSKAELINKLRGLENKYALQAVEELRVRGWLSDASLRGIALCHAQLHGADLMEADLSNVDFHQANLDFVDLSKARLRGAKMNRASLQGVNFDHADLAGADLYKSNLRGARNLTNEQLMQANQLFGALMPDGAVYDGRFNLAGDLALARWAKKDVNDSQAMAEFYGVSLDEFERGQKLVASVSV
jgi:uncharacterized protein YjbI with pentapeptide repeats